MGIVGGSTALGSYMCDGSEPHCAEVIPLGRDSRGAHETAVRALSWPAGVFPQSCYNSTSVNIYWQPTGEQMLSYESSGNAEQYLPSQNGHSAWPPTDVLRGKMVASERSPGLGPPGLCWGLDSVTRGSGPRAHSLTSDASELLHLHHKWRTGTLTAEVSCEDS